MVLNSAFKLASFPAARAAGFRLVTLPISAGLALATTKIIISEYGLTAFGIFSLILAIPALLPSRDFGLGAKVTDVVARRTFLNPTEIEATIAAALAKLTKVACGGVAVVVALQLTVGWSTLLGGAVVGVPEAAVTVAFALFMLGLPGGLGGSILWGLRRNDLLAVQSAILTLTTCLGVVASALFGLPLWVAIVSAMAFNCLIQWVTFYFGIGHIGISRRALLRRRIHPAPKSFRSWALPMFILSTASAVAYQADRLVLSHGGATIEVARYSVAALVFFPLLSVASSAGQTLWGKYAIERELGGISPAPFWSTVAGFAAVGLFEGGLMTFVAPAAVDMFLGVEVPRRVCAAFGLLLVLQVTGLPVGMLMTDPWGLKKQAALSSVMVVLNLSLSIEWAHSMGAAGPVLASAVAYFCAILVPTFFLSRKYMAPIIVEPINPESA